jgi:hypothetical protein
MISSLEECEESDGCLFTEGGCVDNCDDVTSRGECEESRDHCTWVFSRRTGDDGRCVWKKGKRNDNDDYSCSDIKRYVECWNGGGIDILYNECEYFKDKCRKRCSLFSNVGECLKDENDGDCGWLEEGDDKNKMGRCVLKVCYLYVIYVCISIDMYCFVACLSISLLIE